MMKKLIAVLLGLLLCVVPIAGCGAPPDVQTAQRLQVEAFRNFVNNNAKALRTLQAVYLIERNANVRKTIEGAMTTVVGKYAQDRTTVDKDGKQSGALVSTLTVEQALELAAAAIIQKEKADGGTKKVIAAFNNVVDLNANEAVKSMKLTDALNEWMNTGMDEAALEGLADTIIDAMGKVGAASTSVPKLGKE